MKEPGRDGNPLGVAVWGIGAHAIRTVLPALANSPHVRLVGLHSRNTQVIRDQAARYGCLAWPDRQTMFDHHGVDAIFLATPTALHFEQGLQVLDQGKHLWCEKPLTVGLSDTEQLISLAERRQRCLAVVCAPLYHDMFRVLRSQLDQGRIGALTSISSAFRFPHVEPDNFRYQADLGGGALLDLGFYLLSVVDTLIPSEPVALNCRIETAPGYAVDTSGSALLDYGNGLSADLSWGFGFDYQNEIRLEGRLGEITARPFYSKPPNLEPRLTLHNKRSEPAQIPFVCNNQFEEMIAVFAQAAEDSGLRRHLIEQARRWQSLLARAATAAR